MIWLGIDVETTGLDDSTDVITEVGAVLWDADTNTPLRIFNELVDIPVEIPEKITKLTGITNKMCSDHGLYLDDVIARLGPMMDEADYLVAHNAPFDRGFIEQAFKSVDLEMPEMPWIDTRVHIPYGDVWSKKLEALGPQHGFLNPFSHRAVFDVLSMLKVASHYDPKIIVERSKSPAMLLRAAVTFHEKDKAKEAGYRWDGEQKLWLKDIIACDFEEEKRLALEIGFEMKVLKDGSGKQ